MVIGQFGAKAFSARHRLQAGWQTALWRVIEACEQKQMGDRQGTEFPSGAEMLRLKEAERGFPGLKEQLDLPCRM